LAVANKIKANAELEADMRRMVVEGVLSIQKGDNPTIIREKLQAFVVAGAAGAGGEAGARAAGAGVGSQAAGVGD